MARSPNGPSDRAARGQSMPLADFVKNHLIVVLGTAVIFAAGVTWSLADKLRVEPRDFQITTLNSQIASLKEESVKLRAIDPGSSPSCSGVQVHGVWPRRVAANDSFLIEGTAPEMPGFKLWLLASLRGGGPPYNPRGPVEPRRGGGWEIRESAENRGDSTSKHYQIFVVGPAGEVLINEYRRTMNSLMEEVGRKWPQDSRGWPSIRNSLNWPGIVEKTRDMIPCGPPLQVVS